MGCWTSQPLIVRHEKDEQGAAQEQVFHLSAGDLIQGSSSSGSTASLESHFQTELRESGCSEWCPSNSECPHSSMSFSEGSRFRPRSARRHQDGQLNLSVQPRSVSATMQRCGMSVRVSPHQLSELVGHQGMMRRALSRQLSTLSRYSIMSRDESVVINNMQHLDEIQLGRQIGCGGFGKVYRAEYEGRPVAVKVVTGDERTEESLPLTSHDRRERHRRERSTELEALIMASVEHPNLVKTLKVLVARGPQDCLQGQVQPPDCDLEDGHEASSFCAHIIMELCDLGTLLQALVVGRRFHALVNPALGSLVRWDAWAVLETLKEVVSGIMELHRLSIVHGDLKPLNIMLCSSALDRRGFVSKVTDFGMARVLRTGQSVVNTRTRGTVTHIPPELLQSGIMSPSQDVYALGVIMWECLCADYVYKGMSQAEMVLGVATRNLRPTCPEDTPPGYQALAERCWATAPEDRPTLGELHSQLCALQAELCPVGADSAHIVIVLPSLRPAGASLRPAGHSFIHGGSGAAAAGGVGGRGVVSMTAQQRVVPPPPTGATAHRRFSAAPALCCSGVPPGVGPRGASPLSVQGGAVLTGAEGETDVDGVCGRIGGEGGDVGVTSVGDADVAHVPGSGACR